MGSMRCNQCLQPFKSYLRLQVHLSKEHKVKNEFSNMSIKEWQQLWRKSKLEPYDNARDNTSEKRKYF